MGEQVMVVGAEGFPASYTSLREALARAARIGAQLHAVRSGTPVVASRWEAAATGEPVPAEAEHKARAERELTQVVAAALVPVPEATTRVAARHSVVRGSAGPVLVGEADGADLPVVGQGPRVAGLLRRSVSARDQPNTGRSPRSPPGGHGA
jgi:hypothetical protein